MTPLADPPRALDAPAGTLAKLVERLAPRIPAALADAEAAAGVLEAAGRLPLALSRRVGFEARLGEAAARVDFLACVTRAERDSLRAPPPGSLLALPSWAPLRALAGAWAASPSLDAAVSSAWIELDLAHGTPSEPLPSIFFGLGDPAPAHDGAEGWREAAAADCAVVEEALAALGGGSLPDGTRRSLRACFGALPPGAKVFQVGAMLSRGTRAVRVCIRRLGPAIPDFLAAVGWPGDAERLRPSVAALLARVEWVTLDVDVGEDGLLPGIGLECAFGQSPDEEPRWRAFLDTLAADGRVLPAKAEALLAWPGVSEEGEEAWVRALSHVKLAWRDGTFREAKGYFGCWRRALAWRFLQRRVE